ncbi:ribosomal protein S18-alanine N-acetyltransferase [Aliiglaciecola lipolytica]|uniref:[Ribosomal protein bS18]-alanine N-acetyltransferase n=1 Tax=Aliiglaciecola lipolytica E3 TaxID=1127673 RepID=K6YRW4_9ALTE|nr:ribosomal protein S18-alanine N-acetyltransferase [Aliiglaciecola lipolytica]GAC14055.1 ribosomal-protein-alanine N-acetyltransferase [Aliiglaciecola lipolytica E3]
MMSLFQPVSKTNYLAAFQIQQSCHLVPWSESVFMDSLSNPYFAFQLAVDELVVGYYVGLNVVGEATLMDLGVSEKQRGQGLGQQLLSHFIEQCKQQNCEEIWLEVRESNKSAVRLYQKNGFNSVEVRKDYYPTKSGRENGLIMKACLV